MKYGKCLGSTNYLNSPYRLPKGCRVFHCIQNHRMNVFGRLFLFSIYFCLKNENRIVFKGDNEIIKGIGILQNKIRNRDE